jgi:hypothetical protein
MAVQTRCLNTLGNYSHVVSTFIEVQSRCLNIHGSTVTLSQHLWQYSHVTSNSWHYSHVVSAFMALQSRCLKFMAIRSRYFNIHGSAVTLSQHSWHVLYKHAVSTLLALQSRCLNLYSSAVTFSQHSWQLQSRFLNLYSSAVTLSQHSWQNSHVVLTFMAVQSRYLKFMAL